MKKSIRILSLLMTVFVLISSLSVSALAYDDDNSYNGFIYYLNRKGCTITAYTGKQKNIKIPSKINGVVVKGVLLSNVDSYDKTAWNIKTIYIPSTVKKLSLSALEGVKKVTISKKNKHLKIDGKVILNKKGDTVVTCLYGVKSVKLGKKITKIADGAFMDSRLREITIGKNVVEIGNGAFLGCKRLKVVNFNKKLERIGESAFSACHRLQTIEIPEKVEKIERNTFSYCIRLESVDLSNVKIIGKYALQECKKLKDVKLGEKLTTISRCAFDGCKEIETIKLPESLKVLGVYAFYNCSSLKEVEISSNIKKLRYGVFGYCGSLKEVSIPNSVEIIDENAFSGCESLTDIYIYNPECKLYISDYFSEILNAIPSSARIHGYADSTAQKYAEENGNEFVKLEENTKQISIQTAS